MVHIKEIIFIASLLNNLIMRGKSTINKVTKPRRSINHALKGQSKRWHLLFPHIDLFKTAEYPQQQQLKRIWAKQRVELSNLKLDKCDRVSFRPKRICPQTSSSLFTEASVNISTLSYPCRLKASLYIHSQVCPSNTHTHTVLSWQCISEWQLLANSTSHSLPSVF